MKYKNIKSMLHNFAHSFTSLMNYVDDEHVVDILAETVRMLPSHKITIHFPEGQIEPEGRYHPSLTKSIELWANWLPSLIQSHNLEAGVVRGISISYAHTRKGVEIFVFGSDDRGKRYEIEVRR